MMQLRRNQCQGDSIVYIYVYIFKKIIISTLFPQWYFPAKGIQLNPLYQKVPLLVLPSLSDHSAKE